MPGREEPPPECDGLSWHRWAQGDPSQGALPGVHRPPALQERLLQGGAMPCPGLTTGFFTHSFVVRSCPPVPALVGLGRSWGGKDAGQLWRVRCPARGVR